jgi:hypothetical protein
MTRTATTADFWRLDRASGTGFKEWHHVIVFGDQIDLLVNFSAAPSPAGGDRWCVRLIVLVHADEWRGWTETADIPRAELDSGATGIRLGRHRLEIGDRGYSLYVDAPQHGLHAELALQPLTAPLIVHNQEITPSRRLHWRAQPRLSAHGAVTVAGQHHALVGALAYHDHNWGAFQWGDDFAWEWGIALPADDGDWAVLYSALLNRARTVLTAEQLLLWRGRDAALVAASGEVSSRAHGTLSRAAGLRLPPVMALLQPRTACDLPERLDVAACNGVGRVGLSFRPGPNAQIVIPSERDPLGDVTIHECIGPVRVEYDAGREHHVWEGRGVFEFVR